MSVLNWRDNFIDITSEQLYMLENEIGCDCVIIVYDENKSTGLETKQQLCIKVHKHILTRVSPVFETMFTGEYVGNIDSMVIITDIRPEIMKQFLRFIYGQDNVDEELEVEEILELIYAATKYDISRLTEKFYSVLVAKYLKLEYISRILNALCYKISAIFERIESDVFQIIKNETMEYLQLEDALEMTKEDLIKIVQADHSSLKDESKLIEFVNNWAYYQLETESLEATTDNLRKLLENILPSLRVLTLNLDMYSKTIDSYIWFTLEEKHAILKYITLKSLVDIPINICKLKEERCILKQFTVSMPSYCNLDKEKLVAAIIVRPSKDFVMHGIQVESKIDFNYKEFANDDDLYEESLTLSVFQIYENEKLNVKNFTSNCLTSYKSIININFDQGYDLSTGKYYGLTMTSNVKGSYLEDRNFFAEKAEVQLDPNMVLLKNYYGYRSERPERIRKLKLGLAI